MNIYFHNVKKQFSETGLKKTHSPMSLKEIIEEMKQNFINPFNQEYMHWLEVEKQRKEDQDNE